MARVHLAQGDRLCAASLAAWDEIVTAHPGTEMAAEALYREAFNFPTMRSLSGCTRSGIRRIGYSR